MAIATGIRSTQESYAASSLNSVPRRSSLSSGICKRGNHGAQRRVACAVLDTSPHRVRVPAGSRDWLLPLAEHPLGSPAPAHTEKSQPGGENPAAYLFSRYSDRLGEADTAGEPRTPRADAFELHATILRHQIEVVLREPVNSEHDDEAVALASLWSRVVDRPRGPWSAENLASALGVSRTSLYRMVRRQHGTSPARVVERLRADEARRLLAQSRNSIEVIADQVGYASAFSFSAAFKRLVGHSPSRFRRDAVAGATGD